MHYKKTKYKLKYNSNDPITADNSELLTILAKEIPIIWLEKQYRRHYNNIKADIYKFDTCQCVEGYTCKILYLSQHFYFWIREKHPKYFKKKIDKTC